MSPPDGLISARDAARRVGYHPRQARDADGTRNPARDDPEMRCFYEWLRRHPEVHKYGERGRLLFDPRELDQAMRRPPAEEPVDRLDHMAALARAHAHGGVQ